MARLPLQEGRYCLHPGVYGLGCLERVQHHSARKVNRVLAGEGLPSHDGIGELEEACGLVDAPLPRQDQDAVFP